jgi:hypothetical protein
MFLPPCVYQTEKNGALKSFARGNTILAKMYETKTNEGQAQKRNHSLELVFTRAVFPLFCSLN